MYITTAVEGVVVGRFKSHVVTKKWRPEEQTEMISGPRCSTKARERTDYGIGKPTRKFGSPDWSIGKRDLFVSSSNGDPDFPNRTNNHSLPLCFIYKTINWIWHWVEVDKSLTVPDEGPVHNNVEQCWQVLTVPTGVPYITMKFLMCRLMCTVDFSMSHV